MSGLILKNKKSQKVEVVVSSKTVVQVVLVVLAVVIAIAAIQNGSGALTGLSVAVFLALGLNAPVQWLANRLPGKKRGNRTLATGLSFIVILLILTGFAASIFPPLVKQTGNFINGVPNLVEDVRDQDSGPGNLGSNPSPKAKCCPKEIVTINKKLKTLTTVCFLTVSGGDICAYF